MDVWFHTLGTTATRILHFQITWPVPIMDEQAFTFNRIDFAVCGLTETVTDVVKLLVESAFLSLVSLHV